MNAEFNELLRHMAVRLEGAGMQRGKMMGKCEGCGVAMPMEAKTAGDGEMLCEMCQKKAESVEAVEVEEAKKPKLGSGKRFKNLVKALDQRDDVDDSEALGAWIGRMKYGKDKFQKMALKGRK